MENSKYNEQENSPFKNENDGVNSENANIEHSSVERQEFSESENISKETVEKDESSVSSEPSIAEEKKNDIDSKSISDEGINSEAKEEDVDLLEKSEEELIAKAKEESIKLGLGTGSESVKDEESDQHAGRGEEELINFELLSDDDLLSVLDDLLSNKSYEKMKDQVAQIRKVFVDRQEESLEEKRKTFLQEGGLEADFKPEEGPLNKKFNELIERFRGLRHDYNKEMDAQKEDNLKLKQDLLEEFRLLMEGKDSFDNTFRKFKQLQRQWFDVGLVPQQNVKDLWNSYNFFVEKFNDYVKINRELRELDLKKNLELKVVLCEKAEQLADEDNISSAFKTLQKFHSQWRDIGPVPREDKDMLWERFKAATSVVNKKHQKYQSELKDSLVKNLELKEGLCEKAETIASIQNDTHNDWVKRTNELLSIQQEWKTIGYAPKKDNNQIYARFRKACDEFFANKAKYYAKTYEDQKENLKKKEEIVRQAEAIKDSTDWKGNTEKLIELQKKWKEIGPVPRKDSDKLWKQFRASCDYFFNQKSEFYSGMENSYDDNLKAKLELIEEVKVYKVGQDIRQVMRDLDSFQKKYDDIGFVPSKNKEKVRNDFKDAYNLIIEKLDVDDEQKSLIRFQNRVQSIVSRPKAEVKLRFEREKLMNKLQQLSNDIGVWENNIGFFKQTKSSEDTLTEFHDKIEEARNRISLLEKKIEIIDSFDD